MSGRGFRFEALLRVRSALLDECRRELGTRQGAHAEAARRLRIAEDEAKAAEAAGVRQLGAGAGAAVVRAARGETLSRRERARESGLREQRAEARVETAREAVRGAWEELRAFELLRDWVQRAQRREAARREQRELDEVASRRRGGGIGEPR